MPRPLPSTSILVKGRYFYLFSVKIGSGAHPQPPIQWLPGALSSGVKLTTHLHPVPRFRIHGAIPPPFYTSFRGRYNFILWTNVYTWNGVLSCPYSRRSSGYSCPDTHTYRHTNSQSTVFELVTIKNAFIK
jgi:hypothetical protein